MENKINWDFIAELEGAAIKVGYVPSNNSGVTIGTGFDLKEKTEENITNFGFSEPLIEKLKPFFTLSGAEASEVASNLVLNDSEVAELDQKSKNYYASLVANKYEKDSGKLWNDLDKNQQTVVASVGFQYGSFSRTPKFWNAVLNGDWEQVENELRNFGDDFGTRRNKEADLLLMSKKKAKDVKKVFEAVKAKNLNYANEDDGELFLDQLYKTYQNFNNQRIEPTLGEGFEAAAKDNMLPFVIGRSLTFPTFEGDGFSYEKNKEYIDKRFKELDIRPDFYGEFAGVISKEHFEATLTRVKEHQDRREILDRLGWKGVALDVGAFILDPTTWLGYGAATKLLSGTLMSTRLTRMQKFYRSGLAYGTTETALFAPVAWENPTYGTSDVIIAAALGGTLGGGVSAIFTRNLNQIAKAEMLQDIKESGSKLTKKGEKEFKNVEKPLDTKKLEVTEDITEDLSEIKDKTIMMGRVRDMPFGFIFPFTRSGALGTSKSELVRLFNYLGMEEPVGYTFKKGTKKAGQVAPQDDTVELIKNSITQGGHNIVYGDVLDAMKEYLRVKGHGVVGQWVAVTAKKKFMMEVAEVIRNPKSPLAKDVNISKAANAYANGFEFMQMNIVRYKLDGYEKFLNKNGLNKLKENKVINLQTDLIKFREYLPRKGNAERFNALQQKLNGKFDNVVALIKGAILDEQPLLAQKGSTAKVEGTIKLQSQKPLKEAKKKVDASLKELKKKIKELKKKKPKETAPKSLAKWNEKLNGLNKKVEDLKNEGIDLVEAIKRGDTKEITVAANKAEVLAKAIARAMQQTTKFGGFDIAELVAKRDPDSMRLFLDDAMPDVDSVTKEALIKEFTDNIDLITSGRLESRIRLNETFETTIDGIKVRFDELLENDVDYLWQSYVNEMSGLMGLAGRMGLRSRKDIINYQRKLNQSIDEAYADKGARSRYGISNERIAKEEKKTVDSFFKNILGRTAEDDPTDMFSTSLRNLRKFNFMRVLNQVGIAQLPEFGMATAQQGFTTLLQEVPHLKTLMIKAQKGQLDDTFFQELAELGSANGTEYLARAVTSTDVEDIGQTAVGRSVEDAGIKDKFHGVRAVGEKATGYFSGLFLIDSMQRRLTMRLFVNRMAKDLIDVADKGKNLKNLGKRLNRYRVLGFTDEELLEIAKEFSSKNVTMEVTSLGRRVKKFNFANWKNQDLVLKFARRVNRYTQRAVQYNYLGDTNRFFTDKALGKTMAQFRSFIMTAWSKQFLHNIAMADFSAFATAMYTTMIAGLAYVGQTNLNAIGMSDLEKKKYFKKKFGDIAQGDYTNLAMASFQRAGWSSLIPAYSDLFLSQLMPEHRFNYRTSGLEVNLWTGNPTYDLLGGVAKTLSSVMKSSRGDYSFSRTDLNRMMRLLPFQNLYGINNILNFIRDESGLPLKGSRSYL